MRLNLETIEARPVFDGDELKDFEAERKNRAKDIIEDFMIAANGVTARYLASKMFPSLRRVVRTPKRWDRIIELAAERGFTLPQEPDSKALEQFLISAKAADPLRFPDLSLSVIKLMGAGEYVVELPGEQCRRALRSCGQGLYSLHRPEPPIPRSDHAAVAESSDGGTFLAL